MENKNLFQRNGSSQNYASMKERFCAFVVDFFVIHGACYLLLGLLKFEKDLTGLLLGAFWISIIYFTFFWSIFNGKSIGSFLVKIRICSEDLSPLKLKQILVRALDKSAFVGPVGFIIIFVIFRSFTLVRLLRSETFKKKRQLLWDIFSKTIVLSEKASGEAHRGSNSSI